MVSAKQALTKEQKDIIKEAFSNDITVGKEIIASLSKTRGRITNQLERDLRRFFKSEEVYIPQVITREIAMAMEITRQALLEVT